MQACKYTWMCKYSFLQGILVFPNISKHRNGLQWGAAQGQAITCHMPVTAEPRHLWTGWQNTQSAKTAVRQGSWQHLSSSSYLWNTCRHQGEEDAQGDHGLRCVTEETDGGVLLSALWRQHGQRYSLKEYLLSKRVICRELQPRGQAVSGWGDPWETAAHEPPSLWRNTSKGLKLTGEPCQAGT